MEEYETIFGIQKTLRTSYDKAFTIQCEHDKVMTKLESVHDNGKEDRRWQATCSHFQGTRVNRDRCNNGLKGQFVNAYDDPFDFRCRNGTVITAIESVHNSRHEDRLFKFECCELIIDKQDEEVGVLSKSDWTKYKNDFDKPLEVHF